MNDLLTIKEFAEIVKLKPQGIHKQATNENSRLYPYVVQQRGKKFIKREALTEIYQIEQTEQTQEDSKADQSTPNTQPNQTEQSTQSINPINPIKPEADKESIEFYREMLRSMDRQLQEKDRQIAEKDRQIAEKDKQIAEKDKQIADYFTIIDHQQQLHAQSNYLADKKPIAEIEQPGQIEQPKKKKNAFLRWLFGDEE